MTCPTVDSDLRVAGLCTPAMLRLAMTMYKLKNSVRKKNKLT